MLHYLSRTTVAAALSLTYLLGESCSQLTQPASNTNTNRVATNAATSVASPANPATSAENAQVVIEKYAFHTAQTTVAVGAKVTWTNKDKVAHSATSDDKAFDSGLIAPGAEYSRVFDKPGTYPYHCTPHQQMKAQIVVK